MISFLTWYLSVGTVLNVLIFGTFIFYGYNVKWWQQVIDMVIYALFWPYIIVAMVSELSEEEKEK